jgi:cytochrome P450
MEQAEVAAASVGVGQAPPPALAGMPLIGNLLPFVRDPMGLLLEGYRKHGPIFRLRVPGRRFTVLAGPEANVFAARAGDLFASERFWRRFSRQIGAEVTLLGLGGPEHFRLRKIMQRAYSRGAILRRFSEVVAITREVAATCVGRAPVSAVHLMRRAVTQQLGLMLTNRAPGDYFDDIVTFVRTALNVTVLERWPRVLLATPRYRKARRSVLRLGAELLATHRQPPSADREPDLVDDLLAAQSQGRYHASEAELIFAALGPFVAGLDTVANTCAFMLYALLGNPAALERVRADADTLFSSGAPEPAVLKELPALRGAVMETMRLYAIAPFLGRTAVRSFNYGSYAVQAGEDLLLATTLPHHLAECYPDPARFDIDRFAPPRNEHQQAGAYQPFGLGPHTCLGGGMAEIQVALVMATLLHDHDFVIDPPGYRLKIAMDPTPTPGPKLGVRLRPRDGATSRPHP